MIRVVINIKAGKVMPSTLLRKLGSYSKKNYQAFLELGSSEQCSCSTIFLMLLRHEITAITNIVEMYNAFLDWVFSVNLERLLRTILLSKKSGYLDLVASAVILQNTVDMSLAIQTLMSQGELIPMRHLSALSPYITRHIKRYGDYVNLHNIPNHWKLLISHQKSLKIDIPMVSDHLAGFTRSRRRLVSAQSQTSQGYEIRQSQWFRTLTTQLLCGESNHFHLPRCWGNSVCMCD